MCWVCKKTKPNFCDFQHQICKLREGAVDFTTFLKNAKKADWERFMGGTEWAEPVVCESVQNLIFNHPDGANKGLLLFTLCCWLDMQRDYKIVWTTFLQQSDAWIKGEGEMPRAKYENTAKHLIQTDNTLKEHYDGNIGKWFITKIDLIVRENKSDAKGNIYRFAAHACNELYYPAKRESIIKKLKKGQLSPQFSGGNHKRFWMWMMFLRRDESVIKCLFSRALEGEDGGREALKYWYDNHSFDPKECELPVDLRVKEKWNKCIAIEQWHNRTSQAAKKIAVNARAIAVRENMPPSAFDAFFFF